jgi:hypothetical protein
MNLLAKTFSSYSQKSAPIRRVPFKITYKKPKLSKKQIAMRIEFCQRVKDLPIGEVHLWVFTDETRMNISESDGAVRILRMAGEELLQQSIVTTEKFGGGSVSFWGCIGGCKPGLVVPFKGHLSSSAYCSLVETHMGHAMMNMFGTVNAPIRF